MVIPGLTLSDAPADRSRHSVGGVPGVLITTIDEGSPADVAGMAVGDVIQAVDGRDVTNREQLVDAVWRAQEPGRTLYLRVYRHREQRTFEVEVLF
jgi:S1-C subfamily serine protease